jgi:peptidoglycan-N-acetylglucosamine deacetylase
MLKEHGLRGTFYISPQNQEFGKNELLTPQEIRDINCDFEIGAHTLTHRSLDTISVEEAKKEVLGSKMLLEQITGSPVSTFCYPRGAYTDLHVQLVKDAGYRYARTVARYTFSVTNLYEAGTSLHIYNHGLGLDTWRTARFVRFRPIKTWRCLDWDVLGRTMFDHVLAAGGIFHIWGHSWEIDANNDWGRLEEFFRCISSHPSVEYATNGELEARSLGELQSARGGLRLLPAERDGVVGPLDVDLVPEREHQQHPNVALVHGGVAGPECSQQAQRCLAVHPPLTLRLSQQSVGKAVRVALQPAADRDRETKLRALRGRPREYPAHGRAQCALGGSHVQAAKSAAGVHFLRPRQACRDGHHFAI